MTGQDAGQLAWETAVEKCNEQHGTGGMDMYQICDMCGIAAIDAAVAEAQKDDYWKRACAAEKARHDETLTTVKERERLAERITWVHRWGCSCSAAGLSKECKEFRATFGPPASAPEGGQQEP